MICSCQTGEARILYIFFWWTKSSDLLSKLSTNCLSVFGHFVKLALKGLKAASDFADRSKCFFFRFISSFAKRNMWASVALCPCVLLWPFNTYFIINLISVIVFVGFIPVTVALRACFIYGCGGKWDYRFLFLERWILRINVIRYCTENWSSHQRCSMKKGVLRNFAKFTGKHLCQSLSFNKFAGWSTTLLKKRLRRRCFPVNFAKFLGTTFLQNTSGRLLLWQQDYLPITLDINCKMQMQHVLLHFL